MTPASPGPARASNVDEASDLPEPLVSDHAVFDQTVSDQTVTYQPGSNQTAAHQTASNQTASSQTASTQSGAARAASAGEAQPGGPARHSHPLERSSTGLSPRTAAALCYAAAWIGALAFLAFERQSRFVRFHAWQSVLGLGGLFALGLGLWVLAMLMAFVSAGAFRTFAWMSEGAWVALAVTWAALLVTALRGRQWRLPLVGKMAARRA